VLLAVWAAQNAEARDRHLLALAAVGSDRRTGSNGRHRFGVMTGLAVSEDALFDELARLWPRRDREGEQMTSDLLPG
jgi:hypothetical protein